jgi:hypothetical protein
MRGATSLVVALAMGPLFWGRSALAQGKPGCTAQGAGDHIETTLREAPKCP